jgi:hypothetical protein
MDPLRGSITLARIAPARVQFARHRGRDAHVRVGQHDGVFVAGGEFWRGELLEMVHGADAAADGVRADAVLGVHDLVGLPGGGPGERGAPGTW